MRAGEPPSPSTPGAAAPSPYLWPAGGCAQPPAPPSSPPVPPPRPAGAGWAGCARGRRTGAVPAPAPDGARGEGTAGAGRGRAARRGGPAAQVGPRPALSAPAGPRSGRPALRCPSTLSRIIPESPTVRALRLSGRIRPLSQIFPCRCLRRCLQPRAAPDESLAPGKGTAASFPPSCGRGSPRGVPSGRAGPAAAGPLCARF